MTEFAYDADLAGLSYHFSDTSTGLYVFTGGYNDNLATLIQVVMQKARELRARPDRLAVMKEQVVKNSVKNIQQLYLLSLQVAREWRNFLLGQSYSISDYFGRYLLSKRQWTTEEQLAELPCVDLILLPTMETNLF